MTGHHHLTYAERYVISNGLQHRKGIPEIAKDLGRDPSVVHREITRNSIGDDYDYRDADELAKARRSRENTKIKGELREFIGRLLEKDESPEQIAARLRRDNAPVQVSAAAIYLFIWRDQEKGGGLWRFLRYCGRGKRLRKYRRGPRYAQKKRQSKKRSIHARKAVVNKRKRFGDWEMDLVEGKGRQRFLLVIQERKSRYTRAGLLRSKCPREVARVAKRLLRGFRVHTITTDNGFEFADGHLVEDAIKCTVFFTDPYSSWQKGQVEHVNGLLRRSFPKSDDFLSATAKSVEFALSRINQRLRKSLNWLAPSELLSELGTQTDAELGTRLRSAPPGP